MLSCDCQSRGIVHDMLYGLWQFLLVISKQGKSTVKDNTLSVLNYGTGGCTGKGFKG